jgi:DNA-binding response OmpR family regulator
METLIFNDKRNSPRVPVNLTVLGGPEGRRIAMYSENISLDGMFLRARDFVAPRAVFSAQIWLSNEEEPLLAYLTCCFIERNTHDYGIGVYISGMSAVDRAHWENFYRCCLEAQAEQQRSLLPSGRTIRSRRILAVEGALRGPVVEVLHKCGIEVAHAPSVSGAIEQLQAQHFEAVISNLRSTGLDGLALCYAVNSRRLRTRTVLLTDSAAPMEFWLGMHAGAARVIAKPCSTQILANRILEVLDQPPPLLRPEPAPVRDPAPAARSAQPSGELASAPAALPANRRAAQYLGQVYRYLSDRMAGVSALGVKQPE